MILMYVKIWEAHIKHRMDGTYKIYQKSLLGPEKATTSSALFYGCIVEDHRQRNSEAGNAEKMNEEIWWGGKLAAG